MEDLHLYQTECETRVLNIRCRDRKLYLSHDYSGGSLEPGNEQIDASQVLIKFTAAVALLFQIWPLRDVFN